MSAQPVLETYKVAVDESIATAGQGVYTPDSATFHDLIKELNDLSNTIDHANAVLTDFPDQEASEDHVSDYLVPRGLGIYTAFARAIVCVKSLPDVDHVSDPEVSQTLLDTYKTTQVKMVALLKLSHNKIPSIENGSPGWCEYGYAKLKELTENLTQALVALSSSIEHSEAVHDIHSGFHDIYHDSLGRVVGKV